MDGKKSNTVSNYNFAEKSALFMLRLLEGGFVVMVAHEVGNTPHVLKPRPDLFPYGGGFSWGYSGTGVSSLAYAILGNCLDDIDSIHSNATKLVERVLSRIDGNSPHDLTKDEILEALT